MADFSTVPYSFLKSSAKIYEESRHLSRSKIKGRQMKLRPIEELDAFAAQLNSPSRGGFDLKSTNDMQFAGQLSSLSDAYWRHHQLNGDTDIEGFRGQDLQERAYDLLRERLGMWHYHTVEALRDLVRWDINIVRRQQYLRETTTRKKGFHKAMDVMMMLELAKCCLRNDDYGADGEMLRALLQCRVGDLSRRSGKPFDELRVALLYVQIRRKDWETTDQFDLAALALPYRHSLHNFWDPETCLTREDLQIFSGTLDRAERALVKGVAVETLQNFNSRPCAELLIEMYLGQAEPNLRKAEDWLGRLIGEGWRGGCSPHIEERISSIGRELASKLVGVKHWEPYHVPIEREYALHLLRLYKYKYLLADVYARQQRYEEARMLLEEVVDANLHRRNPDNVASKDLLVTVYLEQREPKKAEALQEKIVEDITETFGEGSKELLPALRLLSKIYRMNGQWPKKNELDLCILRYRE